ncbi:hypothetical protein HYV58_01365, partial [Candidatus Peregrinibacteria bacterium]|nr:hypothetical protein [Candidatus Peregrinibacteria bacterium]
GGGVLGTKNDSVRSGEVLDRNIERGPANDTGGLDRDSSGAGGESGAPEQTGGAAASGSEGPPAGSSGTSGEGRIMPELPANWKRPLPCNQIFCVKVETLFKKQSARLDSENCIACHFEKLNDSFKKTIDRNLTPSKATGNLMEGPKCKRQTLESSAAFNIVVIPQPILTPPNDDLVTKQEFSKSFFNLLESYWGVPGGCDSARSALKGVGEGERNIAVGGLKAAGACESPPDAAEEAAKPHTDRAAENEDPELLLAQIQNSVASKRQEASELIEKKRRESAAEAHAAQYRALMVELDAFNAYFEGFLTLFRQIAAEEGESPCTTLNNLPQCK